MALRNCFSYWWFPVFSSLVWLGMLLGMLLYWVIDTDKQHYSSMKPGMTLPYISTIGAYELKPLFIAGSCVVTATLDISFLTERWLRHRGRLVPNQSIGEKILFGLSIIFAIVGTVGLICLSIFDTVRHPTLHDVFLLLFMGGYVISAIFICWEYQRLGIKNREHRHLRISFWIKLTFILVEIALGIAFGVLTFRKHQGIAAYFEWVIAFIFTGYVLSFAVDLYPATKTRSYSQRFPKPSLRDNVQGDPVSDESLPMQQQQPAYTRGRRLIHF
ncbi:unnamed protein product [Clonostachys rhizophaga]|uniref:CWH43-like N-terminal domain-containing protein n=1 Tax=Clonostachys rhizophaga TaxID=160324 RepID=A0A9N9VHK0_9HYPO|nr:unnamed protein product [Clonostachys rhizophaga]